MRVYLAFLFSPVLPCFLCGISLALAGGMGGLFFAVLFAFSALAVCYMVIMTLAIPLFFFLSRRKVIGLMDSIFSGIAIGCFVGIAPFFMTFMHGGNDSYGDGGGNILSQGHITLHGYFEALQTMGEMGLLGASIAFMFWLIAYSPLCRNCGVGELSR